MITTDRINKDIAKIEALMQLGSKREIAKLSKLLELCRAALIVVGNGNAEFLAKQLEDCTTKFCNFLAYKKRGSED